MIKQLRKVGNSNALLLDRPVLDLLGLDEAGRVQLTVEGGALIVTPVNPRTVDPKRFEAALDEFVRERRPVLRKLAR